MTYDIRTETWVVFVSPDGKAHLSREAAEEHAARVARQTGVEWLTEQLADVGGTYYDFDIAAAAGWVIENYAQIGERMGDR